jgi:peptidoglycan/xylan/chitin deacetylase (PgdA/CDA1 family)
MNILKFVLGSRGPVNMARRTGQILARFGSAPDRMGGRFERFMDVLDRYDCRPTFPITALPMSRNPVFAHRLIERGAELAVHAWTHVDLTSLDYDEQRRHMGMAIELFRDHAVPFTGFRAPYLHWNEDTMRVVEDFQYRYSSNQTVWWDVFDVDSFNDEQREGMERGVAFYQPVPANQMRVLPFRRRGFVEIPVSLPDDEITLDRMYTHDTEFLARMWNSILEQSYARGELFTLQLHPERIDFFADAVHGLLANARARKPGVWIATLDEIASWWVDKAQNRATFVREGDGHRATFKVCEGATIFMRFNGSERVIDPGSVFIDGAARPCVGVAPGSSRKAIQALADIGYIVEAGERPGDYAVHLGALDDASYAAIEDCRRRIAACPGPLVRFGTWPHGNHSAFAATGDIDALTVWDFFHRFRGR